jgi:branched-chain amino acid transport system substrate-binding protein
MKKKISFLLILALSFTLLMGCSGNETSGGAEGDVIKIAVAGPLTGDNAEYGIGFKNAVELMVEEWNEKGGVLGKEIQVVSYDDKNSGEEAASIAQRIVSDKDIIGVIGHFASGVSMAASPTYQENKMIEISPTASHPDYSSEGDYIFRNNTVISAEAEIGLDIAVTNLGKTNIGILSIKTDWGTSTANITRDLILADDRLNLVAQEEVIEGSDDYSAVVTKFVNAGADVIIVAGMYNTLAPFARQYKQVDPDIALVGFSNAYSQQLIELGGDAVEGITFPISFFSGSTAVYRKIWFRPQCPDLPGLRQCGNFAPGH